MIVSAHRKVESFTDAFEKLSFRESLNSNLSAILGIVKSRYPDVGRISVAMYDQETDKLKSYLSTEGLAEPLAHLEAPLSILNDLQTLREDPSADW